MAARPFARGLAAFRTIGKMEVRPTAASVVYRSTGLAFPDYAAPPLHGSSFILGEKGLHNASIQVCGRLPIGIFEGLLMLAGNLSIQNGHYHAMTILAQSYSSGQLDRAMAAPE